MTPYVPLTWINNQSPAINAANLNHIEQGINQCSLDSLSSASMIGSGSDLIITIARQSGSDPVSASLDVVTWLSDSAFYSQAYINNCFTEVNLEED